MISGCRKRKKALAEIMLEHGIEWEQKGEHKEHLSVLEFKREKRKEELAELEQSIERVQQKAGFYQGSGAD